MPTSTTRSNGRWSLAAPGHLLSCSDSAASSRRRTRSKQSMNELATWQDDAPKRCGPATTPRRRWEWKSRYRQPVPRQRDMRVREDMVNGFDVCHGGLLFALADTAFAFACNAYDRVTFAASASIEFLRPAMLGDALSRDRDRGISRPQERLLHRQRRQPGRRMSSRCFADAAVSRDEAGADGLKVIQYNIEK